MSKKLATINLNSPVELDEAGLEMCDPSKELLEPLFAELEFRTLGRRVFGDDFSITEIKATSAGTQIDMFGAPAEGRTTMTVDIQDIGSSPETVTASKNINNVPHQYYLADTKEKRAELIALLKQQKSFCFDTETTGTDANNCELVGLSFAVKAFEGWYVPV